MIEETVVEEMEVPLPLAESEEIIQPPVNMNELLSSAVSELETLINLSGNYVELLFFLTLFFCFLFRIGATARSSNTNSIDDTGGVSVTYTMQERTPRGIGES